MKQAGLGILLVLGMLLAACGSGTPALQATASPTSLPSPVSPPPPTPEATGTPIPTSTATPPPTITQTAIPVTLYNRYLGKDIARQPELVQTPPGPIIPVSSAEGYARSYIAVFLSGNHVNGTPIRGDPTMLAHLIRLLNEAFKAQHTTQTVLSSYRSFSEQAYLGQQDPEENGKYLAEPGRSEHQLGTAVDLAWQTDRLNFYIMDLDPRARSFYGWLKENAYRYGFVFSYPYKTSADQAKNNLLEPFITEYKAEPWHLRFVGLELARQIYETRDEAGRNYLDPLSALIPQQFFVP